MSSAFKTLKTPDITVSPYASSKGWNIPYTTQNASTYSIDYITADQNTGTLLTPTEAQLYYRSVRQLYYSNYLPGLAPSVPLSEQDYNQLEESQYRRTKTINTLVYDNYLQSTAASGSSEVDLRIEFPTGSGDVVGIMSIPQNLYGEYIQPNTFGLYESTGTPLLLDDGNGNIVDGTALTTKVGNIIYSHGIIIITDSNYLNIPVLDTNQTLEFKSRFTIYENQVRCHVNENEFNITQNPSAISGSSGSLYNALTGSEFNPYVTTVGLYSAASELLAVAKLGQPYPMPSNTDITFVVKWDS